jgi:hypothetical protein
MGFMIWGHQERNLLPFVAPIDAEVAAERKYHAAGNQLQHAHETCIRLRHWNIGILTHQRRHLGEVFLERKAEFDNPALHRAQNAMDSPVGAAGEEACFRKYRLTRE